MSKDIFLGIDAGTTKLKAALVDCDGMQIDMLDTPISMSSPMEGACEINMLDIWEKVCIILKCLSKRNEDIWKNVVGVGITGQGDGLWAIDKSGIPVRNAMLWNDTRTKLLDSVNYEALNSICIKNSTTPLFPGAAPVLLKWIMEKEPTNAKKIHSILHCKDWINYKLTGQIYTDYSDASTALMNIYTKKYDEELLEALGLGKCKNMFPEPIESTSILGKITKEASAQTGIKENTPVIAGAIDVAATAIGMPLKENGEACTIVGTTLCNELVLDEKNIDNSNSSGSILCYVEPGKYLRVMAALSGASSLDWVRNNLVSELDFKHIEEEVSKISIGSNGVIYHPYIFGERAPFRNSFACGGFYGLTSRHNKFNMVRAAYEGLALSMYDCYKALPQIYKKIHISGGGAASDMLCQMISDCIGVPIIRPFVKEVGIHGIVNIMKVSFKLIGSFSELRSKEEALFVPCKENHDVYDKLFGMYKGISADMEKFWIERSSFINS